MFLAPNSVAHTDLVTTHLYPLPFHSSLGAGLSRVHLTHSILPIHLLLLCLTSFHLASALPKPPPHTPSQSLLALPPFPSFHSTNTQAPQIPPPTLLSSLTPLRPLTISVLFSPHSLVSCAPSHSPLTSPPRPHPFTSATLSCLHNSLSSRHIHISYIPHTQTPTLTNHTSHPLQLPFFGFVLSSVCLGEPNLQPLPF